MRVTPTADYLEWMKWVDPLLVEPYSIIIPEVFCLTAHLMRNSIHQQRII